MDTELAVTTAGHFPELAKAPTITRQTGVPREPQVPLRGQARTGASTLLTSAVAGGVLCAGPARRTAGPAHTQPSAESPEGSRDVPPGSPANTPGPQGPLLLLLLPRLSILSESRRSLTRDRLHTQGPSSCGPSKPGLRGARGRRGGGGEGGRAD